MEAYRELDCPLTIADDEQSLRRNLDLAVNPERIYTPAAYEDGHPDHNWASGFAASFFEPVTIVYYETYAPRGHRTTGVPIEPEPWMIARKLSALSCFRSQIEQESTRPWFFQQLDLREWIS